MQNESKTYNNPIRIALVPLDSRPANWQFPQRLADMADIELLLPPREILGTLHKSADSLALAQWLADNASRCQAAVVSWDALLHGGLVQSRKPNLDERKITNLVHILERINWQDTAGYGYITIPRLGVTIDSDSTQADHQMIREYLIACGNDHQPHPNNPARYLAEQIGKYALERVWEWRKLNHASAQYIQLLSSRLRIRHLHFAKEDNAIYGPHLREEQSLRDGYTNLMRNGSATRCSFFDGADECACLLLAKAWIECSKVSPLPVRLRVYPSVPGPERYTGLYESQTLADGLNFIAKLLGFEYTDNPDALQWLVTYGLQPQPDVFDYSAKNVFDNPYLLPSDPLTGESLFCSDLSACNGTNPHLCTWLAQQEVQLAGYMGFNTNFNTLGVIAAWLSLARTNPNSPASRRFSLERLADDVCYQSLARPRVLELARSYGVNALDFMDSRSGFLTKALEVVNDTWDKWLNGQGASCIAKLGITNKEAAAVSFEFPWHRAFEIETCSPKLT